MSFFLCLVRPDGGPVDAATRHAFASRPGARTLGAARWVVDGAFAARVGSDVPGLHAEVARACGWVGVGLVRLDRPEEVRQLLPRGAPSSSPLSLLLAALARRGADALERIEGDFALVAWHAGLRALVAARDAFGVRRLFLRASPSLIAASTRASALADGDDFDEAFLATFLANGATEEGTPWAGVDVVRGAETVTWRDGAWRRRRWWPGRALDAPLAERGADVVARFGELLASAVRVRLGAEGEVWAQLSGGMDSSSVVAVAETLHRRGAAPAGLSGTITLEGTPPTGGDRVHAELVAREYALRHEVLGGHWLWQDDGRAPPLLDVPMAALSNHPVQRRMADVVHRAGGRVLLAGVGADLYLRAQIDRPARLLHQGRVREAVAETATLAAAARVSFWKFAFDHLVAPSLPRPLQGAAGLAWQLPPWVDPAFAARTDMRDRLAVRRLLRAGESRAHGASVAALLDQGAKLDRERIGEANVEWRYPFLDRRLVEYGLRLPEAWRFLPGQSKRVLREAMRGVLPEAVRTRQGKGGLAPHYLQAVRTERARLLELARTSRLAAMECVRVEPLVAAIEREGDDASGGISRLISVLSLELWVRAWESARAETPSDEAPPAALADSLTAEATARA